jgi:hypothetical protein
MEVPFAGRVDWWPVSGGSSLFASSPSPHDVDIDDDAPPIKEYTGLGVLRIRVD